MKKNFEQALLLLHSVSKINSKSKKTKKDKEILEFISSESYWINFNKSNRANWVFELCQEIEKKEPDLNRLIILSYGVFFEIIPQLENVILLNQKMIIPKNNHIFKWDYNKCMHWFLSSDGNKYNVSKFVLTKLSLIFKKKPKLSTKYSFNLELWRNRLSHPGLNKYSVKFKNNNSNLEFSSEEFKKFKEKFFTSFYTFQKTNKKFLKKNLAFLKNLNICLEFYQKDRFSIIDRLIYQVNFPQEKKEIEKIINNFLQKVS